VAHLLLPVELLLLLLLLLDARIISAVKVVQPPLVRVGECLVGSGDLLEALLCVGVLILIGMVLAGGLSIRGLDVLQR
jgi:hypothetical protein